MGDCKAEWSSSRVTVKLRFYCIERPIVSRFSIRKYLSHCLFIYGNVQSRSHSLRALLRIHLLSPASKLRVLPLHLSDFSRTYIHKRKSLHRCKRILHLYWAIFCSVLLPIKCTTLTWQEFEDEIQKKPVNYDRVGVSDRFFACVPHIP